MLVAVQGFGSVWTTGNAQVGQKQDRSRSTLPTERSLKRWIDFANFMRPGIQPNFEQLKNRPTHSRPQ